MKKSNKVVTKESSFSQKKTNVNQSCVQKQVVSNPDVVSKKILSKKKKE